MLTKLAESVARLGWHPEEAVLNGDLMCNLLHSALKEMDPVEPSLVRPDESLDLFVTTTNVHGYETAIPSGAGGISHTDLSYRQLLRFHYDQEHPGSATDRYATDFSDVPALAFAARATASFPGAFPPVSLGSFLTAVDATAAEATRSENSARIAEHFVYGLDYGASEKDQWFMDGGVLDNGPFDHVIDAIAAKRADGLTAREIIYIEPDPGAPPHQVPPASEPSFAETVWSSRITIPQHTPLVAVLDELEAMNAAIAEVGAIVEAQQDEVLGYLDTAALSGTEITGAVGYDDVTENAQKVRAAAQQLTGNLGYATYCRLRAQAVAESFGMSLAAELHFPSESNRTNFMVAVLGAWARQQEQWKAADPDALEAQLGAVDMPFRLRRAEFVLQGINALFDGADPSTPAMRTELVTMKSACWDLLTELRAGQEQVASAVHAQAAALFGPHALTQDGYLTSPDAFARQQADGLRQLYQACLDAVAQVGVRGSSRALWETLRDGTGSWDQAPRTALLSRYVGFPVWDALIFPVISLAKLPQLTPITVQRFSPLDATCLRAVNADGTPKPDPSAKLDGVSIGHFGAFFDQAWRENDYLWGRLDGAELAFRLLSRQSATDLDLTEYLRTALMAILTSEKDDLALVGQVWQALAAQVGEIKPGALNEG